MKPMLSLNLIAAAAAATTAAAQTPPATPAPAAPAADAPEMKPADPDNILLVETTKGRIIIEMRPDLAPQHVARIKALTRKSYYDNSQFYRVVRNFVVQTGDKGSRTFTSDLPNLKAEFTFSAKPAAYHSVGGYPGGEVGFVGATAVRIDTPPGGALTGWVLHCPGVAAFAHQPNDNSSANSQFYITRGAQHGLDKEYSAFGRVIAGLEVLPAIQDGEPPANPDRMTRVRVLSDVPAAERPQILVADPKSPGFARLAYNVARAKGSSFSPCDVPFAAAVR